MKDGVARKLGRGTAHRWSMLRCARRAQAAPRAARSHAAPVRLRWSCSPRSTMVSQLIFHERIETTVHKARGRRRRRQRRRMR